MKTCGGGFTRGLLSLCLLAPASCSSDDGNADSAGGSSGSVGSEEADGSVTPAGGAGSSSASGAGAGGGTGDSGGGGSGSGGNAPALTERIRITCSNWQANGYVLGCTAVGTDTYVADCTAELTHIAETCQAEVEGLLDCSRTLTVLEYACNADNDITLAAGACSAERADLDNCAS